MDHVSFNSPEELLAFIIEKSDDIDEAIIVRHTPDHLITKYGFPMEIVRDADPGMILKMMNQKVAIIHTADAERVLNEGILSRMGIKITLESL